MKSVLVMLSGTTLAALSFVSLVYGAASLRTYGDTHEFQHLGNPLWTFEPTYVSRGNQKLDQVMASAASSTDGAVQQAAAPAPMADDAALDTAHVDWCLMRYRSYRAEDNTYQPYSGPRQDCVSPYVGASGGSPAVVVNTAGGQITTGEAASVDVAAWCQAQYRSYRVSDNTYQPYDGPRRACVPDFGI